MFIVVLLFAGFGKFYTFRGGSVEFSETIKLVLTLNFVVLQFRNILGAMQTAEDYKGDTRHEQLD